MRDLDVVPDIRQLGHRRSDDLDFFVDRAFSEPAFLNALPQCGLRALVLNRTPNHTELTIRSLKIDLIREQLPLKYPLKQVHPDFKVLKMADAMDIGRMKLMSAGSRGSKKDFVDIYCLTREKSTLESLIQLAMEENRDVTFSRLLFLKGLVDFEEADAEPDPRLLWNITWPEVKRTLTTEVKAMAGRIG